MAGLYRMERLLILGINHTTAPLALREALYFDSEAMRLFLRDAIEKTAAEGVVGLCTCNRTEFYVMSPQPQTIKAALIDGLEKTRRIDLSPYRKSFYSYSGEAAIKHLCRVASGVDSMVIGEDQILKQMRQAYHLALHGGFTTSYLNLVFERAFMIAKRARHETRISEGNISVASVAVSFIKHTFADVSSRPALLIGAGETGELVAHALLDAGVKSLAIANRTPERARELAEKWGAATVDFDNLEPALLKADIVVCATGSPTAVLTAPMLKRVMAQRGERILAAIDLSVPRNIDPAADKIDQLFVYDIEALQEVCEKNKTKRQVEARKVEALIDAEVRRFVEWSASLNADAVIRAMRNRIETIRQREISRYGKAFHEHEFENLDRFTRSLLNKVLHDLTANLKSMARESDDRLMEFDALCRALNLKPDVDVESDSKITSDSDDEI